MRRTSPLVAIVVGRRRFRLRLDDFLVRIWLLYAFMRRTLPDPVTVKRFLAPLWVFIFGMTNSQATVVAFFQKTARVARFRFEVMVINSRTVLHFLEMDDVLFLFCLPRLFGLFKLELAEVHDADDRWASSCCDFDEIQPKLYRLGQCYVYFHDAKLTAVGADDADWADPDLPVYPWRTLRGILNRPCSR